MRWLDRIRAALRPPRRLRMLRPGLVLILGIFGLGFATLNTGNNVLYLLMGALLGLIAVSGWLSEQTLRRNRITRVLPASVTAGHNARIEYRVGNHKKRLPTVALEITEASTRRAVFTTAFIPVIEPGSTGTAAAQMRFERRGIHTLSDVVVATSYPFGLFRKERDLSLESTVVVWPRTDRSVRIPRPAGRRGMRRSAGSGAAAGAERGDFRALRAYRTGDDPRDIHWRSTARRGEPIMRDYDRDAAESWWLVLDTTASTDVAFEIAVEITASLAARAAESGERVGFAAGSARIAAAGEGMDVGAVLDVLARVEREDHGSVQLPAPPSECVVVTARPTPSEMYADVFTAQEETAL